jgi:hypothetical protein
MVKRSFFILTILANLCLLLAGGNPQHSQAASPVVFQGTFIIVWGDGTRGSNLTTARYFLATKEGESIEIQVSDDLLASVGGPLGLNRQEVSINGAWHEVGKSVIVHSFGLHQTQNNLPAGVFGSQPWVSILCKFADVSAEPDNLEFFKAMYSSEYPGLDHFWRQNSYNLANLEGSGAYGWFVLPHDRAYYLDDDGNLIHQRAAEDCTAVADPYVNYRPFVGINMMFNDLLDCCAWGGGWDLCLDGLCQVWRMTWEPPWGYQNIGVIAHETGHGFGLPHSLGNCQIGYDNRWDVMSDVWSNGTDPNFPQFGTMGQHTISYHKEMLEWISADQQYVAETGTSKTITLEKLALPQTDNYLGARILIDNSLDHFYTLEVRRPTNDLLDYDKWLPGSAVIIHDVVPARGEPAVVIDQDGNCDTGDAGAMYIPGEVFVDATNGIRVTIDSSTPTGYVVTISNRFIPMERVDLTGPGTGGVGENTSFSAAVSPAEATIPITYTWEATGQLPVEHLGDTDDSVNFTWEEPGSQLITVTASNSGGSVVDTHFIEISSLYPMVSIEGPHESAVGVENKFTATSIPQDVTLPITYTWTADGQSPITNTSGLTDTVTYIWDSPGLKLVQVIAENVFGSSSATFPVLVRVAPERVELTGVERGMAGEDYQFSASVSPITTTIPITYVWTIDDTAVITHTAGITDTLELIWDSPGVHQLSVQASNPAGIVEASRSVKIYLRIYLPLSWHN